MGGRFMFDEAKRIKIHFMYVVIILVLVSGVLGGALLLGHKSTITTLSNASLLLSIVLAVVAILITLWDVAGQKNNVATLQEMITGLRKIIVDFEKISEDNGTAISELKEITLELNERVILYESKFAQIENLINNSEETKMKEELQKLLDKNGKLRINLEHRLPRSVMIADVIELLKMENNPDTVFSFNSFYELLKNHYDIPIATGRSVINGMLRNGQIEEYPDKNGKIFYKLVQN
jgi:hypothetical protein